MSGTSSEAGRDSAATTSAAGVPSSDDDGAHRRANRFAKQVYSFGSASVDGGADMKQLLGGKGANLSEMARLGLSVPPGFTVTTEVCAQFPLHGTGFPPALEAEIDAAIARIEHEMGKGFGDPENPLLLSVRSGARASMPGMMDTVLNLGLNAATVAGLVSITGDSRFAYDCHRRFIQMFADVVLGLKPATSIEIDPFEKLLAARKRARGVALDRDLASEDLAALVEDYKELIRQRSSRARARCESRRRSAVGDAQIRAMIDDELVASHRQRVLATTGQPVSLIGA